jgi:formylmethanofuran dehydrogenase subunit E
MNYALSPDMAPFWEASLAFHGHSCPGLALGCRVAVDALKHMVMEGPSRDEELVCVAETDSCAVDAIQAISGCTLGKGNLLLRLRGKHAFSFYHRDGKAPFRIVSWIPGNT